MLTLTQEEVESRATRLYLCQVVLIVVIAPLHSKMQYKEWIQKQAFGDARFETPVVS